MLKYAIVCDAPTCHNSRETVGKVGDYSPATRERRDPNLEVTDDWRAVIQEGCYTLHFCSKNCLLNWARTTED